MDCCVFGIFGPTEVAISGEQMNRFEILRREICLLAQWPKIEEITS
jgi:hypothetical protein